MSDNFWKQGPFHQSRLASKLDQRQDVRPRSFLKRGVVSAVRRETQNRINRHWIFGRELGISLLLRGSALVRIRWDRNAAKEN